MKRKMSDEHRRKISEALKGKRPKNLAWLHEKHKGEKRPQLTGDKSPLWKGDAADYSSIHVWVSRHFGTPSQCEKCGTGAAGRYEWHNLSGDYHRVRDDWQRLCVSCHRRITFSQEGYVPWSKGKKIQLNTGRTHIKPGQHLSKATEFQKGQSPWNQHLVPRWCEQCGKEFQPREDTRKYCGQRCYWDSLKKES